MMRNSYLGFSLIELLIVIFIMGIIASFSYPTYHSYMIRAHQSEGQTALMDLACRMENYYSLHDTYQTATIGLGKTTDVLGHSLSHSGGYTLSIVQATDKSYTLQATSTRFDTPCQILTLNNLGTKGVGTGSGRMGQCWG